MQLISASKLFLLCTHPNFIKQTVVCLFVLLVVPQLRNVDIFMQLNSASKLFLLCTHSNFIKQTVFLPICSLVISPIKKFSDLFMQLNSASKLFLLWTQPKKIIKQAGSYLFIFLSALQLRMFSYIYAMEFCIKIVCIMQTPKIYKTNIFIPICSIISSPIKKC